MDCPNDLQMVDWIFRKETTAERVVRLGFGGYLIAAVGAALIDKAGELTPSDPAQFIGSFIIAFLLFSPKYFGSKPKDIRVSKLCIIMALAYSLICMLYLVQWLDWHPFGLARSKSYDTTTDVIGSLIFVFGWHYLSKFNSNPSDRKSEQALIVVLGLGVIACGLWKGVVEAGISPSEGSVAAARLLLNAFNGATFLSLYIQMRRLLPSPDPLTHLLIVLFGCAQIAASGRDCLSHGQCTIYSAPGVAAYSIAWMLLAGKMAFGIYVLFLYYNGCVRRETPDCRKRPSNQPSK